jgi:predicted O-methyltransferase YrrM
MITRVRRTLHHWLARRAPSVSSVWRKRGASSWLSAHLGDHTFAPPQTASSSKIRSLTAATEATGPKKLWEGYGQPGATRTVGIVSTRPEFGNLFSFLARERRPAVIVEFGAAFGVSGMYWLDGLQAAKTGELLSFEVNPDWAEIARLNISQIGNRFRLTVGTFEDNIHEVLKDRKIDVAYIDAIHTSEFVNSQFALVRELLANKGIVLFDDIDFSADMDSCWNSIVTRADVQSAVEVNKHVGIIEMA